eukprot:scaffold115305_cov42-Phaeocystis_antarctica.AAC.1
MRAAAQSMTHFSPVGSSPPPPSLSPAARPVGSHSAWHLTSISSASARACRCALRSAFFLRSEAMSVSPKGSPLCVKWLLYFLKKLLSGRKSVAKPMREGARSMIVTRPSRELPLVMPICGSKRDERQRMACSVQGMGSTVSPGEGDGE